MAIGKTNAQDKSTNYWQVQKIEEADYHFKKNDSGYWVNTNAATGSNNANTAAVCKVFFRMAQTDNITFTINQDSESGYDYGIINALDTDDDTILKSFQNVSGTQTFTTNVPKGEHFVYIKYRKDNSASSGTDTFQFTISSGAIEIEEEKIDLSGVTATAADVLNPKVFIDVNGDEITGTISTVTQATPSISVSSAGLITASSTQSTGYVEGDTKSATKQLTTKGATTYTPTTSNQTISSGTYLTGTQTIKGDSNLEAANIKSGVSIFGVTGTLSSGATVEYKDVTRSAYNIITISGVEKMPKYIEVFVTGTQTLLTGYPSGSLAITSLGYNPENGYKHITYFGFDASNNAPIVGWNYYTDSTTWSVSHSDTTLTITGSESTSYYYNFVTSTKSLEFNSRYTYKAALTY